MRSRWRFNHAVAARSQPPRRHSGFAKGWLLDFTSGQAYPYDGWDTQGGHSKAQSGECHYLGGIAHEAGLMIDEFRKLL